MNNYILAVVQKWASLCDERLQMSSHHADLIKSSLVTFFLYTGLCTGDFILKSVRWWTADFTLTYLVLLLNKMTDSCAFSWAAGGGTNASLIRPSAPPTPTCLKKEKPRLLLSSCRDTLEMSIDEHDRSKTSAVVWFRSRSIPPQVPDLNTEQVCASGSDVLNAGSC